MYVSISCAVPSTTLPEIKLAEKKVQKEIKDCAKRGDMNSARVSLLSHHGIFSRIRAWQQKTANIPFQVISLKTCEKLPNLRC